MPLGPGYPHADTVDALRMFVEAGGHDGGWFITLREGGAVVGDCGTKGWADEQGRVEIGYGLAPAWRARGLGTEAVTALVQWLAVQADVRSIAAEVEIGNVASRRILERLGFRLLDQRHGSWWFELSGSRTD